MEFKKRIMAGIYIHIPFCKQKCYYCDFFNTVSLAKAPQMLNTILRELVVQRDFLKVDHLDTIYIGGGTPSVYSPQQLQSIIECIATLWDISTVREITVELNPDDLSQEYLEALSKTSVNRLSIGIQSFVDDHLKFMNRRHTAAAAIDAVQRAQVLGFNNITIDLIYGIPSMSISQWESNIEQALALGVQHISAYHLTIEPQTVFGKLLSSGNLTQIDDEQSEQQYLMLHTLMSKASMEHYEISNFAAPGFRAQHNSSYWRGEPYLGVGPSAHSFNGTCRRWSVSSIDSYLEKADSGEIYSSEELTLRDCYNEYIMTSLRCADGADTSVIETRFAAPVAQYFAQGAQQFIDKGVMIKTGCNYRIDPKEFLIADSIISELFASEREME